jgi:DNA primase
LDSDESGMDSMIKYIPMLLQKGFSIKVIRTEAGKDPADLCKKYKFDYNEIMAYMAKNAEPAMNVLANYCLKEYEMAVVRERTKVLSTLLPIMPLFNQAEQIVFTDMLYKRLDLK